MSWTTGLRGRRDLGAARPLARDARASCSGSRALTAPAVGLRAPRRAARARPGREAPPARAAPLPGGARGRPGRQGAGSARRCWRPGLDLCDREGLPAYLETATERNLAFYARHGFRSRASCGCRRARRCGSCGASRPGRRQLAPDRRAPARAAAAPRSTPRRTAPAPAAARAAAARSRANEARTRSRPRSARAPDCRRPAVVAVENGRIAIRVPWAVSAATSPITVIAAGETSSVPVDASPARTPVTGAMTVPAACSAWSTAGILSPMKSATATAPRPSRTGVCSSASQLPSRSISP